MDINEICQNKGEQNMDDERKHLINDFALMQTCVEAVLLCKALSDKTPLLHTQIPILLLLGCNLSILLVLQRHLNDLIMHHTSKSKIFNIWCLPDFHHLRYFLQTFRADRLLGVMEKLCVNSAVVIFLHIYSVCQL